MVQIVFLHIVNHVVGHYLDFVIAPPIFIAKEMQYRPSFANGDVARHCEVSYRGFKDEL